MLLFSNSNITFNPPFYVYKRFLHRCRLFAFTGISESDNIGNFFFFGKISKLKYCQYLLLYVFLHLFLGFCVVVLLANKDEYNFEHFSNVTDSRML